MPIYEYACECGCRFERFRPMSDYKEPTYCECGKLARKQISAPRVIPDIEPYKSVVTGERIKGRAHHRTHLKDHGLIEVGNEKMERKVKELPPLAPDIKRSIEELRK